MSEIPVRQLLSVNQAAHRLGVGRTTVYSLIDAGELERVRIGRRALVPEDSCDRYVARLVEKSRSQSAAVVTDL